MKLLTAVAMLMFLVAPVVGIVALVFRVDVETWNLITTLVAVGIVALAVGGAVNLTLRGFAKLEEARALNTAADARRIHGIPRSAPTYNTTIEAVNVLSMRHPETGDVQYLPSGNPARAGRMMHQYALQGYELETKHL